MATVSNLTFYVAPPTTAEVGSAYVRLALGLAQRVPGLLHTYLGPADWLEAVLAEPPSLELLRTHAIAVATAAQKSDLPRNRRERLLRNIRALLWLIRAQEGEHIIFSEQVRLLLDLQPESAGEEVFQTVHETLAALLPGSGTLTGRWAAWQAAYTLPAPAALPFLAEALATLRQRFRSMPSLSEDHLRLVEIPGTGTPCYRPGELIVPREATLRLDRLFHLALQLGYGGAHSIYTALSHRYAKGEGDIEGAVLLNFGPDQVLLQGLPPALLPELELYAAAIPALLAKAGLPAIDPEQLQAIHLAEDALQWGVANAVLLLHSEGLRPRSVRRYLAAKALLSLEAIERRLPDLTDPLRAAHVFAPLVGGPLVKAWLSGGDRSVETLLTDPPVPSTMAFEVRFGESA